MKTFDYNNISSLVLVLQPIQEKKNSEFKLAVLYFKLSIRLEEGGVEYTNCFSTER